MCLLTKNSGSVCCQYAYALTLSGSLSRYIIFLSRLTCPFSDKIKYEISKYMVDSNIGYDYLLLISTVHYLIMLLLTPRELVMLKMATNLTFTGVA